MNTLSARCTMSLRTLLASLVLGFAGVVTAAPTIGMVACQPNPLQVGQAFTIRAEGSIDATRAPRPRSTSVRGHAARCASR